MGKPDVCVRVAIRMKPVTSKENDEILVKQSENCQNTLVVESSRAFTYDQIFNNEDQEAIYDGLVRDKVQKLIQGYDCSFLAYGNSGSGKTFTCFGTQEQPGIIFRSLTDCFRVLKESHSSSSFKVAVSFVEIYNERVYDLFAETSDHLSIQKSSCKPSSFTQVVVDSAESAFELLQFGTSSRHTRPTKLNVQSSRSHAIFTIHVDTRDTSGRRRSSSFYIVDLAGSEGVKKTGNQGAALAEGNYINQGLLALGKVLQALSLNAKVIPYRDSVLTMCTSFYNPNTHITLLGCIDPKDLQGTMTTLRFTQTAKSIKLNPQVNVEIQQATKTPYKAPFRALFNQAPMSSIKKTRHTIATPRKVAKTPMGKLNSTTLGNQVTDIAEFYAPNKFQEALAMIEDVDFVGTPEQSRCSSSSVISSMSDLNVSTSTTMNDRPAPPSLSHNCSAIQSLSPLHRRIEHLESLLEMKFQQLYETFSGNMTMETRRMEVVEVSEPAPTPMECDEPNVVPFATRRSIRIAHQKITSRPPLQNIVNVTMAPVPAEPISKAHHKQNVLNALKSGSSKQLQELATIGPKYASQIMRFRSIKGNSISTWKDAAKMPIWKGKHWERFLTENLIK